MLELFELPVHIAENVHGAFGQMQDSFEACDFGNLCIAAMRGGYAKPCFRELSGTHPAQPPSDTPPLAALLRMAAR